MMMMATIQASWGLCPALSDWVRWWWGTPCRETNHKRWNHDDDDDAPIFNHNGTDGQREQNNKKGEGVGGWHHFRFWFHPHLRVIRFFQVSFSSKNPQPLSPSFWTPLNSALYHGHYHHGSSWWWWPILRGWTSIPSRLVVVGMIQCRWAKWIAPLTFKWMINEWTRDGESWPLFHGCKIERKDSNLPPGGAEIKLQ